MFTLKLSKLSIKRKRSIDDVECKKDLLIDVYLQAVREIFSSTFSEKPHVRDLSREAAKEISLAGSWTSAKYQTTSVTCTYRSGQPARQIEKAESPSAIRAMLHLDTSKIKAVEIYMYT